LRKSYGRNSVFNDFNLEILADSIAAVTGRNGCGKTTLLRIIATLVGFEGGVVEVSGVSLQLSGKVARALVSVGFPNQRGLFPNLKVGENLLALQSLGGGSDPAKCEFIRTMLGGMWDLWPHELSTGMRQMVHLSKTFLRHAEVYLFDEPFLSLDQVNVAKFYQMLSKLRADQATVIISTQAQDLGLLPAGTEIIHL